MRKTIRGFFYEMKISRCAFHLFVLFSVLTIKSVQNEELVDIQSWAGFQGLNALSVGAVADDCKKIFDSCRADCQKIIDDLTQVVKSTQDAAVVPPKLWDGLGRITDILQHGPKDVRFHFAGLGDHFLKKLKSIIGTAKSKNFDKIQDLENIYNSGVDPTNDSVLELEKSFSVNYNPNSILQQSLPRSLKQASYSPSVAEYELKHLSTAVTEEIDGIEKAALQLLNRIYAGITMTKEVSYALKKTGAYPTKYDEPYIVANLQNCSFLAKALKPGASPTTSPPVSTTPGEPDNDADPVIPSLCGESPDGDDSGCSEIFRKSEKKIMQQLILTTKEIKPIDDRKEIDSRMFQVFKNYSLILSNLNKKIITNVITVVNQFFQLYNIVLSILDKINPDMKSKAENLLYLHDIDTSDAYYENVNKYIVEDYLSSAKMNELLDRVDNHVKSMKSLAEIKTRISQELNLITNELGVDLQTFKSTILYVFEELKKGVKSLQNLKNKSNRTGFRYYLNFYRGKADLAQLRKLICIINSLKIDLLLERQLFTDDEELQAFKDATTDVQTQIDQKNQKLMEELNTMNDFNFVQGFVSRSVLDYNLCLENYTVQSRTILKKVITKYVTVFEELIIIIKRRKIKNAKTIEDLYLDQSTISTNQDKTIAKYLLEKTDIDIEKLCSTLNQEITTQNKETVSQEIHELSTVTHSEVTKINQTVLKLINTMSTEIQNLKTIRDEASQSVDYEISDEKMKCISNIIEIIESLHIKSNKEEIQSLSIYFERVKENIQMASQNFETQTSECTEIQQFRSQVETLKTSIFDSLTKASLEINEKIRRVLFEYNEKLFILRQNSVYSELNSLQGQDSTFTLKDYTRKYVTGYYTSDEIFTALDTIMSSSSGTDVSQLKASMYAKLDETNQNIESELEKIHDDLNLFVEKFSQGMTVLSNMENKLQKQTDQSVAIDTADLSVLKEVDGMVNVIGKYVNVNAESSQRELRVQIDNARLQISKQLEQVSESVTSTQDSTQMESIMTQSISNCESIYNELKNSTRCELTRSVEEFFNSYQNTVSTLHSKISSSNSQTTILQDLNKGDCTTDDSKFQNFMQLMIQQDYQSSTTVSNTFEYMKKYNFVDSQTIKEKCSQVFQSLSNKMNIEIDNISRVSKYVLENVQKANNVLIKLENCENKQTVNLTLTDEELREFRIARSINELWKYTSQDTTISSISTTITNARSQIDLEYRKIQTKLESSSDQSVVHTEIETSLQNIQNIFQTTQTQVNEIVKQNVESFYTSMTSEINEFQSSGSSTLNTALQSVISNRSISSSDQQQKSSTNVDFNSFTNSVNIQQIYNEIKTKTTENSSQTVENFKQVINEKFSKVEKTTAYVVENVQKGYSVMEEIKSSLQLDSNYQLTQYQEEQLKKCVSVSHKIGNLKVDAKTAQTTITNSINSVKTKLSEEYTKVSESVSSLTDEKSIQETASKGVNKFEQLYAQAKDTVKEQLSLASSGFYSSFTNTINNLQHQSSSQVSKTMRDIENDVSSYQSSSDQSYIDSVSYFNSKNFKSCLSVKNWFHSIQSTSSLETYSTVNEKCTKELSTLNDNITTSFDKMETSSTYVLQSIEKSTEMLTEIEESVKQDSTYQLTEEQITEFQKCISIYKSIQSVTTTSTSTARESIQTSISNVKNEMNSAYMEITQSISSSTDENSIKEVTTKGVQKFEQIFSQAKESVKEELFQSFNSFYNSFTQITTDSKSEINQISSTLQSIKSNTNTYQCNDQSYQETVSYFNSEIFKSCVTVKNWFNEVSTSSSSTTSSNLQEKTINEFNTVNEKINTSLERLETSSSFILQTIESTTQIFKQIETSIIQGVTYELRQEQITQIQKCMSIYQSVQTTVTSTSTFITQQKIQADITNAKEEITSAYSQITQSISSCSDDNSVRQVETTGVDNYEQIFSHATETIKEQLSQKSSDFYSMFTQLSTDMHQENLQQSVITSENTSQSETDQSFTSMTSCFTNMFKSTSVIKNWYSEIKKSTSESDWSILSGGLSGKVTSDFGTLNDKVTKSIDSMQESSNYVLDSMKKGFETIKQVKECMVQDSNYKLTQEQVTCLQKCVVIHQTIQKVMTTSSTTATTEVKQTMQSDISNMKSLITDEFNKASETIKSLSDETSINEAATKSVDNMDKFFSETKGKVQSVLSDSSSTFYGTYQKVSSMFEKQENSQIKQVLSDIVNNKSSYQYQNDQSFSNIVSYLNNSSYKSTSTIQNWYNEIKSTSSTSQSSSISENTISRLSNLNEKVTKSITSMEENSSYVIDTIEKGSEVLKQIEESTNKNSSYQLTQEQVTYLQKCITIYQVIQSITTTTTSTTVSTAKKTITSDISNVKSKITDEYAKVTESLKSLTDENSIQQVVSENVSKVDQCYSETKQKVQTELNQASSDFFNNYQQITSSLNKQDVSTLQDIVSGKSTYQAASSDETYSKMVSYLNSDTFKSTCSMQNWYKEIHSSSSTNQSSASECAIQELSTLNDRVTKSIDSMEECSNYVLDTIDKGSEVIKQIQQSTKQNTNYHLSQIQITELQKTISIYQIIQSITITNKSTTVNNTEQTITSEVSNVKNQINEESTNVVESIRSLSDESSIKKAVDDHVSKVEQYYGQVKDKVQTQLTDTSSSFFNTLKNCSLSLNTQSKSETSSTIQDIVNGKSTYQIDEDQSFKNVVTYLNSDSFKSCNIVQNMYQTIQSDSSSSKTSNYSEQAVNNLSTFSNNVSKSVDSMEENSKYVLDTLKSGSEVIQQIEECAKKDSNYKITQEQITILQKCITIYQIIETITTTTTTTSTTTVSEDEKTSKTDQNVNQANDTSQNSVVSNVGRSIANVFGMGSESKNDETQNTNKEESTVANEKTADSTNQSSTSDSQQSSTDKTQVKNEVDLKTCDSTSISNTQEKISSNVTNAKSQINDEFAKTSQSLSSMTDETSIKKTVDENVQKVDRYYAEAKKEVQTQLTQTTSSFYNSCQKLSENTKSQNSQCSSVLQEIVNDKSTYEADDDENFKQVLTYLNSDSFKSNTDVQDWYKEIHSDTCTSDLSKHSVDELGNLNGRVTKSVDTMENHSKYILDTLKQGSEILKQVEDSSKQNVNYELTQNQIIILKKCITIYQIIETITTTTTTVTNTVSVKNNSVSNHSMASDDEYEYEIETKKNTKEVVQIEETTQEENVAVDKKDAVNSNSAGVSKTQTNDEKKTVDSSVTSVTNIDHKDDDQSANISTSASNAVSNDSVKHETKSLDDHVDASSSADSALQDSIKNDKETNSQNGQVISTDENTVQKIDKNSSLSENTNIQSNVTTTDEKNDVKSDVHSTTDQSIVSKKSGKTEEKKAAQASKIDKLKKFTQEQNTYSKTSLTTLMVNWTVTKSTTTGVPNTCASLRWEKYFNHDDDESIIKEIADLLAVGRSVIEDSITLRKEKLPLYRDVDDIEMMVVSSTDIVNEILLQLSEVVGQDVQTLEASFSESMKKLLGPDPSLVLKDATSTLDKELLAAASTFFSMTDKKKTDLLNQINRQFNNIQIEDEKQAREIATKQFDRLQSIMNTVLDNIDCLVLRVVDIIETAKRSTSCAMNDKNCSISARNGQVLCDAVKIPMPVS